MSDKENMCLLRVLFLFFIFLLSISPHDFRDDPKKNYKRPIEIITIVRQNELEKYIQENLDKPYNQIEHIKTMLNEYYAQFVEEKRILDVRRKSYYFALNNTIR